MLLFLKKFGVMMVKHFGISLVLLLLLFSESCFSSPSISNKDPTTLVITCATGELGSSAARLLASDHHLILTGRNVSKLKQLQEELKSKYPWCYDTYILDYSSSASITQFKNYLDKSNVKIAGFVLITPRPSFYGKLLLQEQDVWLEVFKNTFTGPVEVIKTVLPHLSRGSKIVAIAGTTSVQFQPEAGPSCVIRRMWTTYAKALSHQLGPQGIYINTISPGVVLTNFHEKRIQNQANENGVSYEDQMAYEVSNIPLRRHAQPQEIAKAIRFYLSEESNFMTGTNVVIDGGFTVNY